MTLRKKPEHPMAPKPEDMAIWLAAAFKEIEKSSWALHPDGKEGWIATYVAEIAFAAGADAELEACSQWLSKRGLNCTVSELYPARRPEPSLKEQALKALNTICQSGYPGNMQDEYDYEILRKAIESLPDKN